MIEGGTMPRAIMLRAFLSRLARFSVCVIVMALLAAPAWSAGTDIPDEPQLVTGTGDFNRDGIADLVKVTSQDGDNSGRHFLTVLLGRADGTFAAVASQSPIGADPRALVVGDFNGDGNPDVIVGDADGALMEFLGDGRGGMIYAGNIATLGSVASIAVGRFTHSGNLDLAVSDFRSNSGVILLGAGNGSFQLAWSFQLPRMGQEFHIATADFNQDGIADLAIANDDDDNYEVMLGNGNGTFTYAPAFSHIRDPNSYCPS
jgi:FG-GAP-like repeat